MHKAGWSHRDISAGNLYYHEDHGKIGDLEYAKHISDSTTHLRTVGH